MPRRYIKSTASRDCGQTSQLRRNLRHDRRDARINCPLDGSTFYRKQDIHQFCNRMIIRADGASLLFITQPYHARLAADLLSHWKGFADHPRRAALLLAAREHDNGWREL